MSWEFRGSVLALLQGGLSSTEDVERAVNEALAAPRLEAGTRLLWEGRESQTPVSSDDAQRRIDLFSHLAARGLAPRIAVLPRADQGALAELGRAVAGSNESLGGRSLDPEGRIE